MLSYHHLPYVQKHNKTCDKVLTVLIYWPICGLFKKADSVSDRIPIAYSDKIIYK